MKKLLILLIPCLFLMSCVNEGTPITEKQLSSYHYQILNDSVFNGNISFDEDKIYIKYQNEYFETQNIGNSHITNIPSGIILAMISFMFLFGLFIGLHLQKK